ncbi:MAG: acyltransferase [Planctomycetota bacterium]
MIKEDRFHGFDYLRVVAMLAVIYVHGCDTNDSVESLSKWLSFPVPCFLLMAAFLAQMSERGSSRNYLESLMRRVRRLIPPFLAWSAIYLIVRKLKATATGESFDWNWAGSLFWGDAAHQLYFVPLLIYSFVLWLLPMQWSRTRPGWTLGLCAVAGLAAIASENVINSSLPPNRYFIAKSLVWFPIGILAALIVFRFEQIRRVALGPAFAGVIALSLMGFRNVYVLSIGLFVIGCCWTTPAPKWVQRLSALSFGIYLGHVLIIETMQFGLARIGLSLQSAAVTLGVIGGAAALSVLLALTLDHFSKTKWLVR